MTTEPVEPVRDFLRDAVAEDLRAGRYDRVITRFPPEPNGYLHIGHAKAICIDFGIAQQFAGYTNLRFDDTNPAKEEQEFVNAIERDVQWLGFQWKNVLHASDYFEQLYDWALLLIKAGKAFVCDLTADQIRQYRGTLTEPGRNSPWRDRPVAENLDLFDRMRKGEFPDGAHTLRAKIDMASPNLNMRDPVMYRILHATHHRSGDKWCIYPTYDYTHGQSDWIEGITHSLCDISFEDHRPLYEWYVNQIADLGAWPKGVTWKPRQIEFARGNITYLITAKRKLKELVTRNLVTGWTDPRMPTLAGMRRRGYPAQAIREFWTTVGVAKRLNNIEFSLLEHCVRDVLNRTAPRAMAVLNPLKVVITNYPENGTPDLLDAVNNPEDPAAGSRKVPFAKVIYVERDDFMENPPKQFYRLSPGREVRLRYAYFITCQEVVKDDAGNVIELRCTYDPATRGGDAPDGRKVKATIHWVSAEHAIPAEIRLYDHLFTQEDPEDVPEGQDWLDNVNRNSLTVLTGALVEPSLASANPGTTYQFERQGYFCVDPDSTPGTTGTAGDAPKLVFNRTVTLKDTWAKIAQKGK
ncbi:MAG: glutamine--tRNA ligase/YqeY domain fusion protein [Phycisphaeraceae bacterium]|nr:glutamine--tRNA ligase/YqeY domain fusion protein [Phycisphaeraceae bacterium]